MCWEGKTRSRAVSWQSAAPCPGVRLLEGGTGWPCTSLFSPRLHVTLRGSSLIWIASCFHGGNSSIIVSEALCCACLFLDAVSLTLRVHGNQVNKPQNQAAQHLGLSGRPLSCAADSDRTFSLKGLIYGQINDGCRFWKQNVQVNLTQYFT